MIQATSFSTFDQACVILVANHNLFLYDYQRGESPRTSSIWPQWHENKPFALVLILIGSFLVVFLMAKVDKIQKETAQIGNTITIDGQGSAIGKPDVATVTIGVDTKADDVAGAQEQNSTTSNALTEKLKHSAFPPTTFKRRTTASTKILSGIQIPKRLKVKAGLSVRR